MTSERWRQIEQIYHAALLLPPEQRPHLLERACEGDADLKCELETLLLTENAPLSLLDHAPWDVGLNRKLGAGTRLGCYQIEAILGEGGMGAVYRARDTKLGRDVAFKVLSPAAAVDPSYLRRFEDEARLASCLNHPNIVTIYGVGEEDGVAYIAMELVKGRTLQEHLANERLSVRAAVELGVQLADALAAAHSGGVIHRDLKPANIMITPEERIKVLDFGLAKRDQFLPSAQPAGNGDAAFLTGSGVILGTVGYMSPEQASGNPATYSADQFSFGAILYEMLTGRRAFRGPTAVETLSSIIRDDPPPIQTLNREVTDGLREIVELCLAKRAADRFASTADLAFRIKNLREQLDSPVPPSTKPAASPLVPPKRRPWSRRRVIRRTGLAVAAAALAAAGIRFWPGYSGIRLLAVLPFENTAHDAESEFLCDGLTDTLIRQIAAVPSLLVRPRNTVISFKNRIVDPQEVGRQLKVDAVVTGSIVNHGGRLSIRADLTDVRTGAVLWTERYDRDQSDLLRVQDEIASAIVDQGIRLKLSGQDRSLLTRHSTNDPQANELFMRAMTHQDRETEEDYLTARQLFLQAIDRDKNFALAYVFLAANYTVMAVDGYARPLESWPLVKTYAQQALKIDPGLWQAHGELGSEAFWNQWNWRLAEEEFRRASPSPGVPVPVPYVLEQWAIGRPDEALQLIRRTRSIDPLNSELRVKLADILHHTGQQDSAASVYEGIVKDQPGDGRAYFGLAEVRASQGHFEEALDSLRQAYRIVGEDNVALLSRLGKARGEEGYRSVQKLEAQVELTRVSAQTGAPHYVSPLDLARAYARLDQREEAFTYLESAFQDHAPGLVFLNVDHAWDAIRDDPRFARAVKRVGLP